MQANNVRLEKSGDSYEVVGEDMQVTLVRLDYRFGVRVEDAANDWLHIEIGTSFLTRSGPDLGAAAETVDPPEASELLGALAVRVRFQELRKCGVTGDGVLSLEFGDGSTIDVPPHPDYEAWDLDHLSFKIIAQPGGRLAVWSKGED